MVSRRMLLGGAACLALAGPAAAGAYPVTLTDAQWQARLTLRQYAVLRQQGTEIPFTSPLLNEHRPGLFSCAGCAQDAFSSRAKFDSGTGWPSFWQPLKGALGYSRDTSAMEVRTEAHCSRCGGHLGHVFDDGPRPTGLRYCMNGQALLFRTAAV